MNETLLTESPPNFVDFYLKYWIMGGNSKNGEFRKEELRKGAV